MPKRIQRDECEILAEFLNDLCSDWPPISVPWNGRGRAFTARRWQMRRLAGEFIKRRDAVLVALKGDAK